MTLFFYKARVVSGVVMEFTESTYKVFLIVLLALTGF